MFENFVIYAPLWIPGLIALIIGIYYFLISKPQILLEYTKILPDSFNLIITSAFFWFPILLIIAFWNIWIQYVRARFLYKLEWVLLEIKLPQEITKSPLAMETFLMSLYQTGGETTFIDRYWEGKLIPFFSLEIVSIEGQVKFFIYAQKKFKKFIETGLYAQYQNIEIHEAIDYTKSLHFDPKEMDLYVTDYKLANPDPFPIKTYIDYGIENESVDEENKIDPINSLIEFMGSIGANQQCWLQIIIRGHRKMKRKTGTLFEKTDKWKDEAKEEIDDIRKAAIPKSEDPLVVKFPNPTKGEQERIAALDRSISKVPFDVGIRSIYTGKKDFFDPTNISGQRTMLKAYDAPNLNGFKCTNWTNKFDYPWQDFRDIRKNKEKKNGLEAYKRRSFFYPPYNDGTVIVLNVEELASIFHLPGKVSTTPTLTRIPSKKAQAPSNLPI